MWNKLLYRIIIFTLVSSLGSSCKKFLDEKSNQALSTPSTLDDLQLLLNNSSIMNAGLRLINTASDEYYVEFNPGWNNAPTVDKDAYIWESQADAFEDWYREYTRVFYANTILDNLQNISVPSGQEQRATAIKGAALFYRAYSFYQIAQLFAPAYNPVSANSDLGIVLRLNSDFNIKSQRSSVQESYDRIVKDALDALPQLPDLPQFKTQPSKAACYALLARTYLQIGDYLKAKENANACLQLQSILLDFNNSQQVNPSSATPIAQMNTEVIFHTRVGGSLASSVNCKIDTNLYKSYDTTDVRRKAFFLANTNGGFRFKGSYDGGSTFLFNGLAVDEVYLIRAEASARLNDLPAAEQDIKTLLLKRYTTGQSPSVNFTTSTQATAFILNERRKELLFRGLRWADLKRLNLEPSYATAIQRKLNNQSYTLAPNDLRYSFLIPQIVMTSTALQQNPR